ncbi:Macoilin-2 [Fasciola gigantica]|uniref:Macoilin n=1 Tax=Fasciola gigantica TaxID=46835 RepID=A0A504YS54_FASGI|nr:Macoilin-2 [Fasciola gigantica]
MYIRRRNCEHSRIKRNNRKSKTLEAFNSVFGTYFKLLLIWAIILMLDFFTDFRFEFLYSCWLFARTVVDSFRYQGLAFALFFTLIALTSDLICYFLVPTALIYLLGSSFVWVQLVWQADRGVYGSTMVFCFLFVYVEVAVRLRDPKTLPLSIDLCRPFAAHCIGYPAVTLGFGLKTMVAHHLRLRKQRSVEAQNSTFFALLEEALPREFRYYFKPDVPTKSKRGSPSASTSVCPALTAPVAATTSRANGILTAPSVQSHSGVNATANVVTNRRNTHNTNNNSHSTLTNLNGSGRSDVQLVTDSIDACAQLHEPSTFVSSTLSDVFGPGNQTDLSTAEFLQRDPDDPENDRFSKTSSALDSAGSSWPSTTADMLVEPYPTESTHSSQRAIQGIQSRENKVGHHCKLPSSSVCSASSSGSSASVASSTSSLSSSSSNCLSHCQSSVSSSGPTRPTAATAVDSRNPGTGSSSKSGGSGGASGSMGNTSTTTSTTGKPSTTTTSINSPGTGNKPNSGGSKHPQKDEYTLKLEAELRRWKSELQSLRALEIDLRTQVQQLTAAERTYRSESAQARQESESLQTKLNQLTQRLQADRANLQTIEKRLAEERKQRAALEQQIAMQQQQSLQPSRSSGRSRKDTSEEPANSPPGNLSVPASTKHQTNLVSRGTSTVASSINASGCFVGACLGGESCAHRIDELEAELHALTRDLSAKELQLAALKDSRASAYHANSPNTGVTGTQRISGGFKSTESVKSSGESGHPTRRTHPDSGTMSKTNRELMTRLTSLQEENQRLTDTLKEEDKMKQELMTAYHSSLKEITELNATLTKKEYQIVELNMRMEHLTPQLCDYMHMLNGSVSVESAVVDAVNQVGNKLFRSQQQNMPLWPTSLGMGTVSVSGGENSSLYSMASHPSVNTNLMVGKFSGSHKPHVTGEDLSCVDLRFSNLMSNGVGVSAQHPNPTNYLSNVSMCSAQDNYGSDALDAALRGLCHTASGRTVSSADYGQTRFNSGLNIQGHGAPGPQSHLEPTACFPSQQLGPQFRQSRSNISTTTAIHFDVGSNMPLSAQNHPYQTVASTNPSQFNRCKSSSGNTNRIQSPCSFSMSSGRPLPVGSAAPPTSPPPFMAPPPGLYNMSNTVGNGVNNITCTTNSTNNSSNNSHNALHLNGNTAGPYRPSSSSSSMSGPVTPLDLQPIFVSTPLEVVVQSDRQLSVGFVHSPNGIDFLQRSPGQNATSFSCLMDSLSPLVSGGHGQQFPGTKSTCGKRERTLSQAFTDIVSTSTGNTLVDSISEPGRRPHSTTCGSRPAFNASQGNFTSSTFDASEINSTGVTGTAFLPTDPHRITASYERAAVSSSETRVASLGSDGERTTQVMNQVDTDAKNGPN